MQRSSVVIISGASRGIGRQIAIDCAREGHSVVINYRRDAEAASSAVDEVSAFGGRAVAIRADVSVAEEAAALVEQSLAAFGSVDCVINNAGSGEIRSLDQLNGAEFVKVLESNLVSAFLVSQAAIPHMKAAGGRLIFMSSGAARSGGKISAAYAASKAGLEGLMHYYAAYLRPFRITANAIAPALIETDMVRQMTLPDAADLPMGRLGRAEEVWPLVRMIIETEYLTGQTIHLDAGRYMT